MDWSFSLDDEGARVPDPPPEVAERIQTARVRVQEDMERCRQSSKELADAVRFASKHGIKHAWIAREAGVTIEMVERAIAGETLFGE